MHDIAQIVRNTLYLGRRFISLDTVGKMVNHTTEFLNPAMEKKGLEVGMVKHKSVNIILGKRLAAAYLEKENRRKRLVKIKPQYLAKC
ncbi:MAG: hypothetical protein WC043_09045 [Pseudobdellovibrionaceae bacterium]